MNELASERLPQQRPARAAANLNATSTCVRHISPYTPTHEPVLPLVGGAVPYQLLEGGGAVPECWQTGVRRPNLQGDPRTHQTQMCG